jgi:UDP-N-acetylglucosamine/UDP-N-acetylgalactosamine diphosphorylase
MGSAAQVREGCLLEEQASGAHAVGLKHTILFPYVTLGSLINFCDCFMAGGTSRKDHSEVGSSYIHFNYTANQDKATPSLIGDVPQGVMLDQRPIFLGGQGGMVGPVRIAYGTVVAAGVICRRDVTKRDKLILAQGKYDQKDSAVRRMMDFSPGVYCQIRQKVLNNVTYIANLVALEHWYTRVRCLFFRDDMEKALFEGIGEILDMAIGERLARLKALAERMPRSWEAYRQAAGEERGRELFVQKDEFSRKFPDLEAYVLKRRGDPGDPSAWEPFAVAVEKRAEAVDFHYLQMIHGLEGHWKAVGTRWLQGIVDDIMTRSVELMPSMGNNHG